MFRGLFRTLRRLIGAARNALMLLLGRETTPSVEPSTPSDVPADAEYRRTFEQRSDAEAYASEIPVPTIVVARPPSPEDTLVFDTDEGVLYDVYIVYDADADIVS